MSENKKPSILRDILHHGETISTVDELINRLEPYRETTLAPVKIDRWYEPKSGNTTGIVVRQTND